MQHPLLFLTLSQFFFFNASRFNERTVTWKVQKIPYHSCPSFIKCNQCTRAAKKKSNKKQSYLVQYVRYMQDARKVGRIDKTTERWWMCLPLWIRPNYGARLKALGARKIDSDVYDSSPLRRGLAAKGAQSSGHDTAAVVHYHCCCCCCCCLLLGYKYIFRDGRERLTEGLNNGQSVLSALTLRLVYVLRQ